MGTNWLDCGDQGDVVQYAIFFLSYLLREYLHCFALHVCSIEPHRVFAKYIYIYARSANMQ